MLRRRASGQAGFVITLELVLIFTILGLGLLVGLVAIRNALFKWWASRQAQIVYVVDSSNPPKVLGPVRDFDEHETPRLFYIDRTLSGLTPPVPGVDNSWVGHNYRAMIGVRDDRFTGRQRIFYANSDCTGAICIQAAGAEIPDSRNVGFVVNETTPGQPVPTEEWLDNAGGVGYLYALQKGPSYGIGRDVATGSYPGTLYRQTTDPCTAPTLFSAWESQRVGSACVPRTVSVEVSDINCPPPGGGQCSGGADIRCVSVPNPGGSCSCPDGWFRPTGGANCCPIGSTSGPGTGVPPGQCRYVGFFAATTVDDSDGNPVLSKYTAPFVVNLPPDPAAFALTPPSGTEGTP